MVPPPKGLQAFMASRQPADDLDALSDEDFVPIMDAHNRIVALMSGKDPKHIVPAMKIREGASQKAESFDVLDENAGEEGGEGEEGEAEGPEWAEGVAEGAEGAPAPAAPAVDY